MNSLISSVILVLILILIFFLFQQHILIINVCTNSTLISFNGRLECMPPLNETVVVKGIPYTKNVTVIEGTVSPIDFSFIGNKPLLTVWNTNLSEPSNSYVFFGIPDAFAMHMSFKSNNILELIIMSNQQYVNWVNSNGESTNYIDKYVGDNVSIWFNESTGCAGYVGIIKPINNGPFSIYPNETVLYSPAPYPTGICAK